MKTVLDYLTLQLNAWFNFFDLHKKEKEMNIKELVARKWSIQTWLNPP